MGLLGYWLKPCIRCVWRGDDTFSYYFSHFILKFLSRRLILGPNQEIGHESDPCLVSHVENYVVCILAVTIHPCRNIRVILKSIHWIFLGPLVCTAEILRYYLLLPSICITISYGPNNVTAKTMDGLISSHYLFHGKLQFVPAHYVRESRNVILMEKPRWKTATRSSMLSSLRM